jgi:thymidylate synthase
MDEGAKYFQRGSWDYQFDPEKMDQIRNAIHKYLRKEDKRSRELITSLAETNSQKGQVTAGISMFYFEEEPPA